MGVSNILIMALAAASGPYFQSSTDFSSVDIFASAKIKIVGVGRETKLFKEKTCEVRARESETHLDVYTPSQGAVLDCEFLVNIPRQAHLNIRGVGDIELSQMTGSVEIKKLSAHVRLNEISGPVTLGMAKAMVVARKQSGDLKVLLSQGRVDVEMEPVHKTLMLNFTTGSADVVVMLPSGSRVRVVHRLKFGTQVNEFSDSDSPQYIISMRSETGSLKVQKSLRALN